LTFPLPSGAFITGLAMDRNADNHLVDAVSVPKEKARQAFEIEATKKVEQKSVAVAEVSEGNVFKTRVSSIRPHGGTKLIRLTFISPMSFASKDSLHSSYSFEQSDFFNSKQSNANITVNIALWIYSKSNHNISTSLHVLDKLSDKLSIVTIPISNTFAHPSLLGSETFSSLRQKTSNLDIDAMEITNSPKQFIREYRWHGNTSQYSPKSLRLEVGVDPVPLVADAGVKSTCQPILSAHSVALDKDLIEPTTDTKITIALFARLPLEFVQALFNRIAPSQANSGSRSSQPTRIGIYWDISQSRSPLKSSEARKARELEVELIKSVVQQFISTVNTIDIYYFNHKVELKPKSLPIQTFLEKCKVRVAIQNSKKIRLLILLHYCSIILLTLRKLFIKVEPISVICAFLVNLSIAKTV